MYEEPEGYRWLAWEAYRSGSLNAKAILSAAHLRVAGDDVPPDLTLCGRRRPKGVIRNHAYGIQIDLRRGHRKVCQRCEAKATDQETE